MATDQSIHELLAAADEALAEAGFRNGDFGTARDLAEQALALSSGTGDAIGHAQALNCLGMIAHYENISRLMSGSKPSSADIDSEEKLFRQALLRWQAIGDQRDAAEPESAQPDAAGPESAQPDAAGPEGAQPDAAEPESAQPDAAEPESAQPDAAGPESAQPDAAEPAAAQTGSAHAGSAQGGSAQGGSAQAGSAQALFGLGLVFQVLHSDWMTAMPYFWQALDLVTKPDVAAEAYLRSEVHRHVGFYFLVEDVQPTQAVRHLQLSLDYREELGDPRRIPSGLQALGRAELSAGNRARAIDLLTRAVALAREAGLAQQRIEEAERDLQEASGAHEQGGQAGPESTGAPADPGSASAEASTPAGTDTNDS
jgi:tetratricopeptide (TPR) repeat protein